MIGQLSDAMTRYEQDDNLRCALIFAHGDHFTAGLDLVELQDKLNDGVFEFEDEQIDPWGISGKLRMKPVVVAAKGTCFTGAIELMLNSDVVIASDNCNFAQMEVQRGIMPFLVGRRYALSRRQAGKKPCRIYLLVRHSMRRRLID